jgi:hypothetical protein
MLRWEVIPGLGRTGSGVQAAPVTAARQTPGGDGPRLEYPVYLFDTGTLEVQAYFSPILAFNGLPIRYAVSFDDEEPQLIDLSKGNEAKGNWDKMVADNIKISASSHRIGRPGAHVLKYWLVDAGPVLQKIVVDCHSNPKGIRMGFLGEILEPSYLGPPESPTGN